MRSAKTSNFVRESDFDSLKSAADVIEHLGGLDGRANNGSIDAVVDLQSGIAAPRVQLTNHNLKGTIVHATRVRRKRGIHANSKVGSLLTTGMLLKEMTESAFNGAR